MSLVSIIIPIKNEPYIDTLIYDIHHELKNIKHEIIVVDKSENRPNIKNAKLIVQKSDGLGKAFLEGLKESKGNIIVLMDGDGSHDPKDIRSLLRKIDENDIVIGSKYISGSKVEDPFLRVAISHCANSIARFILGLKIKDPVSGFAAIKRRVLEDIKLNPIGYKVVTELIYKATKKGYRIVESTFIFHKRKEGQSKFNFNEIFRFVRLVLRLKLIGR
ncbi:MAG: glycosyltransferase [Candidatus Aenigmarchaeota archaeon]|nr:glycosyltransferase [Candidatus Aenigmarchaeota archaeon]